MGWNGNLNSSFQGQVLWTCEKITTSAEQDFSCGSLGGNRNSLEVEMRADVVKASILAGSEQRQNWKEGRPEKKMKVVAPFLLE